MCMKDVHRMSELRELAHNILTEVITELKLMLSFVEALMLMLKFVFDVPSIDFADCEGSRNPPRTCEEVCFVFLKHFRVFSALSLCSICSLHDDEELLIMAVLMMKMMTTNNCSHESRTSSLQQF